MSNEPCDNCHSLSTVTEARKSVWSDFARIAYFLACISPLSFIILAGTYPPYNFRALAPPPWSVIWGLLAYSALAAIILGIFALNFLKRNANPRGINHALAAIVLGLSECLVLPLGTQELNNIRRSWTRAGTPPCISNLKQLSLGVLMYTQDYDDHFPPTHDWNKAINPYIKNDNIFYCPEEEQHVPGYAMNRYLPRFEYETVLSPEKTVMLFESVPGKNQSGGQGLLPVPPRHPDSYVIGFVDGHVKQVRDTETSKLIWNPQGKPSKAGK